MSRQLERQLAEDRALRNTALEIVKADIAHLKQDVSDKGVASRVATRMSEGAADVFDQAVEVADDKRGVLAALVAAIALWFARNPIMALFSDEDAEVTSNEEQAEVPLPGSADEIEELEV